MLIDVRDMQLNNRVTVITSRGDTSNKLLDLDINYYFPFLLTAHDGAHACKLSLIAIKWHYTCFTRGIT